MIEEKSRRERIFLCCKARKKRPFSDRFTNDFDFSLALMLSYPNSYPKVKFSCGISCEKREKQHSSHVKSDKKKRDLETPFCAHSQQNFPQYHSAKLAILADCGVRRHFLRTKKERGEPTVHLFLFLVRETGLEPVRC